MKYYLRENNAVAGPYSKLDLRLKQISPDASVCPEDAEDWKKAIETEELWDLFPGIIPRPQEPSLVPTPIEEPDISTNPLSLATQEENKIPPDNSSEDENATVSGNIKSLSSSSELPHADQSNSSPRAVSKIIAVLHQVTGMLRERLLSFTNTISATSFWAQLVKWKWYIGAFAAVVLVAWFFEKPVDTEPPPAPVNWTNGANLDSTITLYTDSIRRAETAIAELQEQIAKLKRKQQAYVDSLAKAQREFRGRGAFERQSRFEQREKDFKEKTIAPLQANVNDCVQNINQKSADIATLRQQIARLKLIKNKQESVLKEQGQNE